LRVNYQKKIPPVIANQTAEWNAFWDSFSVAWVLLNTTVSTTIFPLNVTNQAKITDAFKAALNAQSQLYPLSLLAQHVIHWLMMNHFMKCGMC